MSDTAEEIEKKEDLEDTSEETKDQLESEGEDQGSGDQDQDENDAGDKSESEGEKGESEGTEDGEVEIVLEGKESRPKGKTRSFQNRINKQHRKIKESEEKADAVTQENLLLREKLKLAEMQIEMGGTAAAKPVKPNPDDFEGGADDNRYIEAKDKYEDYLIDQKVEAKLSKLNQGRETSIQEDRKSEQVTKAREAHYDRVEKMGMKTYEEAEDKAVEVMGGALVDDIIENIDDSHILVAFLGKNEDEAILAREKFKKNPAQGLVELGKLAAKLSVRPKTRKAPNPDKDIEGSSGATGKGAKGLMGATFR